MKYDVFISCKSDKYDLAEKVYDFLTANGLNVFFAKNILKKIGSSDYGDAIDVALEQSTHLIVFCTSASEVEKMTSPYVYYEWSSFNNEQRSGRKSGNLITILKDTSVADLPFALRKVQSFSYDNFDNTILSYLETPEHQSRMIDKGEFSKPESKSQVFDLKIKTNEDCNVFIDGEDRGIAEVDKITKFPLAKGEYSLSCVSRKSNRKLDLDDIVIIDGDVVRKVLFNQDTNIKFTTPRNEYSASNISQQKQDKDKSSKVTLDVKLLSVVQSETRINRAISALESCGYNHEDARIIVSCVPYTIKNKSEKKALKIKEALQDAGASVELKYANAEEGKYYDVILTSTGNIIEAIKALNEHCKIDVQKAKEMISNLPAIIPTDSELTLYSADLLKRKLEKAGVTILIKEQSYIDLGLPSRLKWATCNIGAIKPEGCGEYFAWGEIQSKKTYAESNSYTLRKSLSQLQNDGIVNSKGVLTSAFDTATKIRGNKWRMPTKEDFEELLKHCNWTKTTLNGVRGYTVSSKTNANSIFIPNTGYYCGSSIRDKNQTFYWSSSMMKEDSNHSYFLYSQENPLTHTSLRSYGCPIRPVMK